jgi:4-hydroxysphinganine ceramide fatty acyl 2-hydroxylase
MGERTGISWLGLWRRALREKEMQLWAVGLGVSLWRVLGGFDPEIVVIALSLGMATWFGLEYLLHRFLLHLPPPPWRAVRQVHARIHWQHHQTPDRPEFLFVPIWASVLLHAMAAGVGFAVGGASWVWPTILGFTLAFGIYESAHFAAHVAYRPRTRWGRTMKRHHLLHHFKNERYWFGVTHPLMDLVFGTWKRRDDVPKSETARTLGVDPE